MRTPHVYRVLCLLLALVSILAALPPVPARAQDSQPQIEWTSCWMPLPDGIVEGQDVDCGYLIVPESRADPASPTIRLAFAVLHAASETPQPDPLLYLAGGPGGNAVGELDGWMDTPYIADRDLILLDQRGTGYSEPTLDCPEAAEEMADVTQACRDRLVAEGVDLQAYNSAENAADVADLRVALGYEQWNLFGISYGTRLALTVMRDHPEGVRSVVIDSVYPPEANSWEEYGQNTAAAFAHLFESCAADADCGTAYPTLEADFWDTAAQLNAEPAQYSGIDAATGESADRQMAGSEYIDRIFQLLYATENIPFLPWVIEEVAAGNYTALDELESGTKPEPGMRQAPDEDVSDSEGMNLSVECQEEVAFLSEDTALANVPAQPEPLHDNSVSAIEQTFQDCQVWGVAPADVAETQPVVSDLPTIVAAGGFDPITPAKWAQSAASHLPNSFFYLFPAGGHGVIDMNQCSQDIMQAFLNDPSQPPDGSCIDEMPAPLWDLPQGQ